MSKKKLYDSDVRVYYDEDIVKILYGDTASENRFNKLIRAVRTYNMSAYRDFMYKFIPELKSGKVLGNKISDTLYEYELPCSSLFKEVHGKLRVLYRVEGNSITMISVEPEEILTECANKLLDTYKGVVVAGPKDKFKVDLILKTTRK